MSHTLTATPNVFFLLHMFLLIKINFISVCDNKWVRLAYPCDTLGVLTLPRPTMPGRRLALAWLAYWVKVTMVPPTVRWWEWSTEWSWGCKTLWCNCTNCSEPRLACIDSLMTWSPRLGAILTLCGSHRPSKVRVFACISHSCLAAWPMASWLFSMYVAAAYC